MIEFTGRDLEAIREAASHSSNTRAREIIYREFGGCSYGTILEALTQVDVTRVAHRTAEAALAARYHEQATVTPIRPATVTTIRRPTVTPQRPARESLPAGAVLMRATEERPYHVVPDCPRGDDAA